MTKIKDVVGLSEFLQTEKASVLALPIDEEGTLHSAALLFALLEDSLELVFVTGRNTEKCRLLLTGKAVKASCVIGTTKGVSFSVQMRGEARLIEYAESKAYLDAYETKFGKRVDEMTKEDQVVLVFSPSWARCTDYVSENIMDGFKRIQLEIT